MKFGFDTDIRIDFFIHQNQYSPVSKVRVKTVPQLSGGKGD
jgi:hypothetical protein